MAFERILNRLADQELILPYFELGLLSEKWPERYSIPVDSSPYYGRGDGYFHPSSHPLMGARELYYRFHPDTRDKIIPRRRTLLDLMTLSMGSALHAVVQTQMEMVGLLGPDDVEVDFLIKDHHVRGRIDMMVRHPTGEDLIVEMKTINEFGYKKHDASGALKPEWDAQLSLQEYAMGKDRGVLLMVERGGQFQMREFLHHRNDVLLEQIFAKFAHVRESIATNTPPNHCCLADSKEMEKCAARFECWMKDAPQTV